MAVSTVSLAARQKERRQRIIAGVGGAILLLLLVIQVPKLLNRTHQTTSTSTPAAAQTTPTAPTTATPSAPTGGSSKLTDVDITPTPAAGQLVTFSRFESKDPFVQQITAQVAGSAASPTAASAPATTGTAPASTSTSTTQPAATTTTPAATPTPARTPPTSSSTAGRTLSASAPISVNGVAQTVEVGSLFPKRQKIFRLVSVTATTATISIAGGSLEGGATSATLTLGRTLTLMNKANGRRYALRLLSIS